MLRITQQENAKGAKRYYASADYYSEGQEIVGRWGGKAAERLGLQGQVDQKSFDRLCDNLHPQSGTVLTVRNRSNRTVGYDFTFSVPKSVSMLYAMTGDPKILESFRASVDDTMRDIEAEMSTRVRKNRKDEDRVTGNMVWAEFIHTTSRPMDGVPDPQLHAHVFAFNTTYDHEESRWKAGQFRGLKASAPYFQAAFRVRLANKMQDLGFGVERKRDDFEISGVPAAVIKRFSRRTQEIEKIAEERGITDPKRKAELGAETRENKNPNLTWEQLRTQWESRLSEAERAAFARTHRREAPYARPIHGEAVAVDHALDHCFVRESVVPERKLLTEALKRGIGSVTVEGVQGELAGRSLIRGTIDGRAMATRHDVLAQEERIVAFARKGRGKYRPLGDAKRPLSREWLNQGQKQAVRHVLASRDRVTLIRGAAGTGKTKLMQEAVEGLEMAGKKVVVLAPSVGTSHDVLRNEGFAEADTVARFFKDESMQEKARGQVIWVDEASLLGTQDMVKLFDKANDLDCRIVLSGDRRQHRAVDRGEPLKLIEQRAGLAVAEVTEILRQSGDYRTAVNYLSNGRIQEGFAELDKLGWIKEVSDTDRYHQLAAAYLSTVGEKTKSGEPLTALVVSPTHAEAARITAEIREKLKADGTLGPERTFAAWTSMHLTDPEKADQANYSPGEMLQFHQNTPGHKNGSRLLVGEDSVLPLHHSGRFEVYRPISVTIATGDRLRITANGKTRDGKHRLINGTIYHVDGFTARGDIIVNKDWVIDKEFGHIDQGYTVTSQASQGKSVDRLFVGQSSQSFPASNRRQFYVSLSRGKQQAVVFTDNKQELLQAVARTDEPVSAMEFKQEITKHTARQQRIGRFLAYLRRHTAWQRQHEPQQIERKEERSYGRER